MNPPQIERPPQIEPDLTGFHSHHKLNRILIEPDQFERPPQIEPDLTGFHSHHKLNRILIEPVSLSPQIEPDLNWILIIEPATN